MARPIGFVLFLASWTAVAFPLPRDSFDNAIAGSRGDLEASGGGPGEPVRGVVKVMRLDARAAAPRSGFLRGGLPPRRAPSHGSRFSFPAFLAHGRPGPALAPKAPVSPLRLLHPKSPAEMELKRRQGLQMWQRAVGKGDKMSVSLPIDLRDTKLACTAVPFTQRVTADGCDVVTVHNKLCFGQCSSMFVPPEGELAGPGAGTGALRHRAPCSRCAPSRARTVAVPLRCGAEVQEKRVMVVEECKCETGREEKSAEARL
ncbi:DAN domain family member 5 [Pungitius pungitius]|uniref:DAN domain family member 5 n=1 Tax=Pungitius pungitius TaxID=134920 RepID=UPI002E118FC5